jgi:hypothetical protein
MDSTRSTPACVNRASTTESDDAAAAVCDWPARCPASVRPALMAMSGLVRDTRRASRANFLGLPNDSRYRAITDVCSSRSQASSRSLPLTSALLPTDTNCEIPSPRRCAAASTAMPSAPDCETRPRPPGSIGIGANVAFSWT